MNNRHVKEVIKVRGEGQTGVPSWI